MNPVAGWLKLIGTAERARKLRKQLNRLPQAKTETILVGYADGMPAAYLRQRVPVMCPTKLLFGDKASNKFYLNSDYRPALDAWDTGEVSIQDLRKICYAIEAKDANRK